MAESDYISKYTPSRTDPELLERIFVQRQALLDDITDRVRDSANTGNKHHVLLIGPRGIGKTHFISLLNHRITQDPKLTKRLRIAWFSEDETITSFVQLLKRTYQILTQEYPDEFSSEWLDELLEQPPDQIQKMLSTELAEKFSNKTLLLIIENLDRVFDGLGDEGQKRWRAFLQQHPFACTIATSQKLFQGIQDREKPFFGFFAPIHLKPLIVRDAVELLGRFAQQQNQPDLTKYLATPEGRSRVRALHHLAGGNHRIYIVLSGFITRESLDDLIQPFEKMADELTPYYQERLRWLSRQQRQIVEFLCTRDSPCTPKQMARQLMTAENTISSQLKKLLELGYVMKSPRGRESLYELTEPLMRLASEVKDKREKPLKLLVDFLRIWYHPDRLAEMLQTARTDSLRKHLTAAIAYAETSPDPRLRAIQDDIDQAFENGDTEVLVTVLEEYAHTANSAMSWLNLAFAQAVAAHHVDAICSYDTVLKIRPNDVSALNNKSTSLLLLGRYDEALDCIDAALRIDPMNANTLTNKGLILSELDQHETAIQCYDSAIRVDHSFTNAWIDKSFSLRALGQFQEAINCCQQVLKIDSIDVTGWCNIGVLLADFHNYESSIECFDNALSIDPNCVGAWNNKGMSLHNLGQFDAAIDCFDKALQIDASDAYSAYNRCSPLFALHQWDTGFEALRNAFTKHPIKAQADAASQIPLIHKHSIGADQLRNHVQELISIYTYARALARLGDGLIWSLRKIANGLLSKKALVAWYDLWLELGAKHEELRIPLRIFRVGIEYLIYNDRRVLLDLIATERRILVQALGLEDKEND